MFRGKVQLADPEMQDLVELVVPPVAVIQEAPATEVVVAAVLGGSRRWSRTTPAYRIPSRRIAASPGKPRPAEAQHLVLVQAELRGIAGITVMSPIAPTDTLLSTRVRPTPVVPETAEVQEVLVLLIPVVQGTREVPETAEVLVLQLQHWV
jgi:hypothetical protein